MRKDTHFSHVQRGSVGRLVGQWACHTLVTSLAQQHRPCFVVSSLSVSLSIHQSFGPSVSLFVSPLSVRPEVQQFNNSARLRESRALNLEPKERQSVYS